MFQQENFYWRQLKKLFVHNFHEEKYWPRFFCVFMDLDFVSVHKHAKKNLANITPSSPHAWPITHISYVQVHYFVTCRATFVLRRLSFIPSFTYIYRKLNLVWKPYRYHKLIATVLFIKWIKYKISTIERNISFWKPCNLQSFVWLGGNSCHICKCCKFSLHRLKQGFKPSWVFMFVLLFVN